MKKKITPALFFATWFLTGLIKPIPPLKKMGGTYGSIAAIPFILILLTTSREQEEIVGKIFVYFLFTMIILILGLFSIEFASEELCLSDEEIDQNFFNIDEVLGTLITYSILLFIPKIETPHIIIGFLLFRFFDIVKIWPTKIFDRMKNSFGVMFDDVIAGIYSAIVLQLFISYVL